MDTYLANKRKLLARARDNWGEFQDRRKEYLAQTYLGNERSEKITENILIELFTLVLDWPRSQLVYQSGWCDITLKDAGIKHLLVEAKYPGKFSSSSAKEQALSQVSRYSKTHRVNRIAICDGNLFYAVDLLEGKTCERVNIRLDGEFPEDLWFVSRHGIYRSIEKKGEIVSPEIVSGDILHPKYKVPSKCFAYVGDSLRTSTWSLPYLLLDGSVDEKRLPKAISAIVSNYRGTKVGKIPDAHIPCVLRRLEVASRQLGKMPDQNAKTAETYYKLSQTFEQLE